MARQRQGVKEDNTPAVITAHKNYDITCTPNAANYYQVATAKYTHVLHESILNADGSETKRYRVVHKGNIAVYTTEDANNYLNLEWMDILPAYAKEPTYEIRHEFIVVEGFSFRALQKNSSENFGYYKSSYYE